MTRLLFFIIYIAVFPLIYILPLYGSTLILTSIFVVGATTGYTLLHLLGYASLVYTASKWGPYLNKDWLWALPTVAMLFEFLPLLNLVAYAPTALLVITLAIGLFSPNTLTQQQIEIANEVRRFDSAKALARQRQAFFAHRAPGVGLSVQEAIATATAAQNSQKGPPLADKPQDAP